MSVIKLKDLKEIAVNATKLKTQKTPTTDTKKSSKKDSKNRSNATGRRKNAVARVWIKQGKGSFIVNGKPIDQYFVNEIFDQIFETEN